MSERYTISVDPASGDSKGAWVLTQWKDDESITVLATGEGEPPFVARVTSEAVRGTRLWRVLSFIGERPRSDGELEAAGFGEVGSLLELSDWGLIGARDDSLWHLTDEGRIIYAALSQGGLAAAEPSAEVADAIDAVRSFVAWYEKHHGFLGDVTPEAFEMVIAAALAATGAAQGEGDTALLDTVSAECIAKAAFFSMLALEGVKGGFAEYKRQSVTPAGDAGEPEFAKILANAIVIMASTILAYRQAHGHSKTQQEFSECIAGFLTEARAAIIAQGKGGGDGV